MSCRMRRASLREENVQTMLKIKIRLDGASCSRNLIVPAATDKSRRLSLKVPQQETLGLAMYRFIQLPPNLDTLAVPTILFRKNKLSERS